MGALTLAPAQRLTVRLIGGQREDWPRTTLRFLKPARAARTFSEAGVVVQDELGEGTVSFEIGFPDHTRLQLQRNLSLGEDWLIEVPCAAAGRVSVTAVGDEADLRRLGDLALVHATASGGEVRRLAPFFELGHATVANLPPVDFRVELRDIDGHLVGEAPGSLKNDSTAEIVVSLETERSRVRVLDALGRPLVGARVMLDGTSMQTDGDGLCAFQHSGPGEVHVWHESRVHAHLPVVLSRETVAEVVFRPEHALLVRALDGDVPVTGVRCTLGLRASKYLASPLELLTDADGAASWDGVGAGTYALTTSGPVFFQQVEVRAERPNDVQVRRTCSAAIQTTDEHQRPFADVSVEWTSLEFDRTLLQWQAGGYIDLPERGATTDSNGQLLVEGLPHGAYRWTMTSPTGTSKSGSTTLIPGIRNAVGVSIQR